jgi:anti-sigma factor RsiW
VTTHERQDAPGAHVEEELTALADGALPPERRAALEAHLAGCGDCRARRSALASTLASLSALPVPPAPRPGFEQRFYARLAREKDLPASWWARLAWNPWRWLAPATGLGVAAAVAFGVVQVRSDELEMARHMDLLEEYVVVASLDAVESPEDVEIVSHLEELKGGRP